MARVKLTPSAFDQLFPDPRYDAKNRKFGQFERGVFDGAVEFALVHFKGRGTYRRQSFDDNFFAAKHAVLADPNSCLYAANAVGRSIVLDRIYFDYWSLRFERVLRG